ncbi:acyl-CoA dehydrogenase family protein, partial [Thermodesulfobacteriota bacterium]
MDFKFSKEQKMYQDSARTFFNKEWSFDLLKEVLQDKGCSMALWEKITDLGWVGLLIDEEHGGIGGSLMDFCPILEEMGRALFPSPIFSSSIFAALVLSEAAGEAIKDKILPAMADGEIIVTYAIGEDGQGWSEDKIQMKTDKDGDSYVLNGEKVFVPYAEISDYIICCARMESTNSLTLFLIPAKDEGITLVPLNTFSIDNYSKVVFNNVKVPRDNVIGESGCGWEIIEKVLQKLIISRCVEMVGGMQKALEITVKYVKERKQFGVPLGSFQVIQHYCADMAIDVETSKYITYLAAWKASENLPCRKDVAMAKSWTGDAYQRLTALALQAHGAIGFTDEYNLHFYYK